MGKGVKKDLGQPKAECDPTVLNMKSSGIKSTKFRIKPKYSKEPNPLSLALYGDFLYTMLYTVYFIIFLVKTSSLLIMAFMKYIPFFKKDRSNSISLVMNTKLP